MYKKKQFHAPFVHIRRLSNKSSKLKQGRNLHQGQLQNTNIEQNEYQTESMVLGDREVTRKLWI